MKLFLTASVALLAAACTPAEPLVEAPAETVVETPAPTMAPTPAVDPETAALSGDWLLTLVAAPDRICRITLDPKNVGTDLLVTRRPALDAACPDAVPITARVTEWSASGDGGVYLNGDDATTTLIELQPGDATGNFFAAADMGGETYELRRP